jgi:hypothetical protein
MAKKNVIGICRMCRKKGLLRRSHYLGRAIHRLARLNGQDPVMMTPKIIRTTQRQLWAHLLCGACEERLNKFGETPILKLIDDGNDFPLLRMMELVPYAVKVEGVTATLSGEMMGIDTDAVAYYALSLLWKGSIHRWPTTDGQTTWVDIRGYKDLIRKYLLGRTGLPAGIYVAVAVCEDKGSRGMAYAPARFRGMPHRMFSFLIRGLWFDVMVDKNAPVSTRSICCVQSDKKVLHLTDCHRRLVHASRRIRMKAKLAPGLSRV